MRICSFKWYTRRSLSIMTRGLPTKHDDSQFVVEGVRNSCSFVYALLILFVVRQRTAPHTITTPAADNRPLDARDDVRVISVAVRYGTRLARHMRADPAFRALRATPKPILLLRGRMLLHR